MCFSSILKIPLSYNACMFRNLNNVREKEGIFKHFSRLFWTLDLNPDSKISDPPPSPTDDITFGKMSVGLRNTISPFAPYTWFFVSYVLGFISSLFLFFLGFLAWIFSDFLVISSPCVRFFTTSPPPFSFSFNFILYFLMLSFRPLGFFSVFVPPPSFCFIIWSYGTLFASFVSHCWCSFIRVWPYDLSLQCDFCIREDDYCHVITYTCNHMSFSFLAPFSSSILFAP